VNINLDGSTSSSTCPIDFSQTKIEFTSLPSPNVYIEIPNPAGGTSVIKYLGNFTVGASKFRILCQNAGTYKLKATIYNQLGITSSTQATLAIIEDLPPVASFSVPSLLFRDPKNSNKASLAATDLSVSKDGDVLGSTGFTLTFDSNNNGNFDDEVILKTGAGAAIDFGSLPSVGRYRVALLATETIPAIDTIPQALPPNAAKSATSVKNIKVDNAAPAVSLSASIKRKIDIAINIGMTQFDPAQIKDRIESIVKPAMIGENIDYQITAIDGIQGTYTLSSPQNISWNYNTDYGRTRNVHFWLHSPDYPYNTLVGNVVARGWNWTPVGGVVLDHGKFTTLAPSLTYALFLKNDGTVWWCGDNVVSQWPFVIYKVPGLSNIKAIATNGSAYDNRSFALDEEGNIWTWQSGEIYTAPIVMVKHVVSLVPALPKVNWRTGSEKCFVDINNDLRPELNNNSTRSNIISWLLRNGATYIGLGSSSNQAQINSLVTQNGNNGEYIQSPYVDGALRDLSNYIIQKNLQVPETAKKYALLGQTINFVLNYSDYESDPKTQENWNISHDPDYFTNNLGLNTYEKDLHEPVTTFDKTGKYTVTVKAEDFPSGNPDFSNYQKWSKIDTLELYVHRAPVAEYTFSATLDKSSGRYIPQINDTSYDLDHTNRSDRGIAARKWQWKLENDTDWTSGIPSSLAPEKNYTFSLSAQDLEGVWSLPVITTFSTVCPPPPTLTLTSPTNGASYLAGATVPIIATGENCHHIAIFINGVCIDVQNGNNYSLNKAFPTAGSYSLYAIARNTLNPDDIGSQTTTSNMVTITVNEYSLSNFEITAITDFQWDDIFWTEGRNSTRTDTVFTVSQMPIAKHPIKKIVAKKGYSVFFDLKSKGFNQSSDTVIIKPKFYYMSSPNAKDSYEVDLYYDLDKEYLIKYGDPVRDKSSLLYEMPGGQSYSVGGLGGLTLTDSVRTKVDSNTAKWFGSYTLLPATKAVKKGHLIVKNGAVDYSEFLRGGYILVNFTIEGYKNGVKTASYSEGNWNGDTIIFDNYYSSLDDYGASTDR